MIFYTLGLLLFFPKYSINITFYLAVHLLAGQYLFILFFAYKRESDSNRAYPPINYKTFDSNKAYPLH